MFRNEIENSVKKSRIYRGNLTEETTEEKALPAFKLINTDSVTAIFNESNGRTAVLNFASYKNPGGMFLKGSRAQEECLCSESVLYSVLSRNQDYYIRNRLELNHSLYKNAAIYSEDVVFVREGSMKYCDVITCAAPNKASAIKYSMISDSENDKALSSRIHFIRMIAEKEHVETLILGAYGCGVFGQDPVLVADLFKKEFKKTSIKNIVFAVPGNDSNYAAFRACF